MQYTIRNISRELDRALKSRAKQLGKSVNQLALEALAASLDQRVRRRNLRGMKAGWSKREHAELERFLQRDRKIDRELWK